MNTKKQTSTEKEIKTITNKSSSYYNQKCRVINFLADEKVELFVIETEDLIVVSIDDISQARKTFKPDSRRSFYEYVQSPKTTRLEIQKTITLLINEKSLVLTGITKEELFSLFEDPHKDRQELIDEFRELRDQGKMDFKLVNNKYDPSKKSSKKSGKPYVQRSNNGNC